MKLKHIVSVPLAAAASMSLAACGGDAPAEEPAPAITASGNASEEAPSPSEEQSSEPQDTSSEQAPSEDGSASEAQSPGAEETGAADLTAGSVEDATMARTLAVQHGNEEFGSQGTVIGQDLEDRANQWDVDVLIGETVYEIKVNTADGSTRTDDEEGADSDDREAASATVTIAQAIDAALTEVPGGIDEVSWDDDDDDRGWHVDVDTENGDDVEVHVDSESGEVLRVEN